MKIRPAFAFVALTALPSLALAAGPVGKPLAPVVQPAAPASAATPASAASWQPAVTPKALSKNVTSGLDFLARTQLESGGWGQGEESANMGSAMQGQAAAANVADTSMAALALLRAGSTPREGVHQKNLQRAVAFVVSEITASDADSLWITQNRGTRVQAKLGAYIDTFMASMFLAEVKGRMPDAQENARVDAALAKVLHKIEKNQRADGGFDNVGWAPVLAQAVAGKGVNRAAQAGASVGDDMRARFESKAKDAHDVRTGAFGGEGSAGVSLYAAAAAVGTLQDANNTNAQEEDGLRKAAASTSPAAPASAAVAARKLQRIASTREAQANAESSLLERLKDPSFVAGFGNNGGEEFLSYMLVSESLVVKGGTEWQAWDTSMADNLNRVQNADGSFSGHHCITGRTFVTAAALLVLTADRAPVPVAARIQQRG